MSAPRKSVAATISRREFARRAGCDEGLVRRAIKHGKLSLSADGQLDPALVSTDWRPPSRGADKGADKVRTRRPVRTAPPLSAPQLEESAARLVERHGVLPIGEALALKETYLARLRQLEYDTKVGKVALIEDIAEAVGEQLAIVRRRLLAIPSNVAPVVARLSSPGEVQAAIMKAVTEALEELSARDS